MPDRRKPIKVGDRVISDETGQHGIVLETNQRQALVHWGTFNRVEFKDWKPKSALTRNDQRVVSQDEIAMRQRAATMAQVVAP
jgi:hypothetical protein